MTFCKCILYFLPRFDEDITICGRADDICVTHVTDQIEAQTNRSYVCDCLPGCFEIKYDLKISMSPLLPSTGILQNRRLSEENVSVLHIFYNRKTYRSEKKEELIGFTEFLCK